MVLISRPSSVPGSWREPLGSSASSPDFNFDYYRLFHFASSSLACLFSACSPLPFSSSPPGTARGLSRLISLLRPSIPGLLSRLSFVNCALVVWPVPSHRHTLFVSGCPSSAFPSTRPSTGSLFLFALPVRACSGHATLLKASFRRSRPRLVRLPLSHPPLRRTPPLTVSIIDPRPLTLSPGYSKLPFRYHLVSLSSPPH